MGWLRIAEMMLYGQDEYKRVRCIYYSRLDWRVSRCTLSGVFRS